MALAVQLTWDALPSDYVAVAWFGCMNLSKGISRPSRAAYKLLTVQPNAEDSIDLGPELEDLFGPAQVGQKVHVLGQPYTGDGSAFPGQRGPDLWLDAVIS